MKTTNYLELESKKFIFNVTSTQMIKGVALLLMLIHHIFSFPDWWTVQNPYIGIFIGHKTLEYYLGVFGKICVSIFAFLTGYGMFYALEKDNTINKFIHKALSFLTTYWTILFFIFLPINLILGNNDLLKVKEVLKNIVAISTSIIAFAWYVRFYILVLLSFPLLISICKKFNNPYICICFIWVVAILINRVIGHSGYTSFIIQWLMEYFTYMPSVIAGICFAQHKVFDMLNVTLVKYKLNSLFISITTVCLIIMIRFFTQNHFSTDTFLTPIFIYSIIDILNHINSYKVNKLLTFLGKHSLNLWFLHAIFFFNTKAIQWVLYFPKYSIVIVVWCILILLPFSILINFILSKINSYSNLLTIKLSNIERG
ncbi:MAG: acyltransferase [Pelosinus sp.]|nr:acyltransferase [Pelosinus sp.]